MSRPVRVDHLRPGDVIAGGAGDTVLRPPTNHDTYWSVLVRCTNGEPVIRSWDAGTVVDVETEGDTLARAFARIFGTPMLPTPHRFDDPSLAIDEPDEPIADDWEADHAADRFFDR